MAYYVEFEFSIPRCPEEELNSTKGELLGLLTREFLKRVHLKYGGSTRWNPTVPGLMGAWQSGKETIPDEITPIWVLVDAGLFDDAMEDFAKWKRLFEDKLHQEILLVTHHVVQTIGSLRGKQNYGQLDLTLELEETSVCFLCEEPKFRRCVFNYRGFTLCGDCLGRLEGCFGQRLKQKGRQHGILYQ